MLPGAKTAPLPPPLSVNLLPGEPGPAPQRHDVAGLRHANHRLEIPLPGLAVNASALEGGSVRHDLHGLLHLLMGKHNLVTVRAKNPFVRSPAWQADAAVPRQLGHAAPVACLAHRLDDQLLQFVGLGLVSAQLQQTLERRVRPPADTAADAPERKLHRAEPSADAAVEVAVEPPVISAATAVGSLPLQQPHHQNFLQKHQHKPQNLGEGFRLEQLSQLQHQNVQ